MPTILRHVLLFLVHLEHTKSFPTSGPLYMHLPLSGPLISLSISVPSLSLSQIKSTKRPSLNMLLEGKPPLLSSPSSYVPAFLLSPSYDVHLLVGLFHVDPPPTLSPIGAEAMPVLSAIKQPQFSTVFRIRWLSVNAHSINHQIKMFHLWNNYNSNFIF